MERFIQRCYLAFLAVSCALLGSGCSKNAESIAVQNSPALSTNSVQKVEARTDVQGGGMIKVGGPNGYVGSENCRPCHEDQHKSWSRTYHRTMTQIPSEQNVKASFNNVVLTNENARFTLHKEKGEYWVRMEPLVAEQENGGGLETRLGLVTGSHHMQVFWVPEGHGNLQLGFPFTWLIPEGRWAPRNSTFIRPPDTRQGSEVWNIVCSRCHTTGVEPHVNIRAREAATEVGEVGIACEACHGPGERHVTAQKKWADEKKDARGKVEPGEIVQPKKLGAERGSQVCGFCHSMKWIDQTENWQENGFRYRPGEDLEKTTPIIRPSKVEEIPALKAYLQRAPELLNEFFWPDGMIRVSGREFNGLIESPCYKSGKFSCFSCHSMHESEPEGLVASKAVGNGACVQCHDNFKEPAAMAAHSRHSAQSSGNECYNCHMPYTTYGVLKAIRSHQISSPNLADELNAGRPNACNLCHLDKSLQWTAEKLEGWTRKKAPEIPARIKEIPDAARLALSGDAGQRAIIAWHLGWKPALGTQASSWVAPLLGELLDDPYSAIRCVAERGMRGGGGFVPEGYDFTVDPRNRLPVAPVIWKEWKIKTAATDQNQSRPKIISTSSFEEQRQAFEPLLQERNNRLMRLRE